MSSDLRVWSDRWEMTASLVQLGAGFIQPLAGGTAMAGRAAKGKSERDSLGGFPLGVCTRHFSKQLDSDRCTAYVPEESVREGEKESERKGWKLIVEYLLMTS